jgi:hypothetical protein
LPPTKRSDADCAADGVVIHRTSAHSASGTDALSEPVTVGLRAVTDSPPCPAILMLDPPRVAPGASRTDTAHVQASIAPNAAPRFEMEPVDGTYRVVYAQAYGSWRVNQGPGELLPVERRTSAPFRIEE